MTAGLEAAGDALTGAIIGRAVEPPDGEGQSELNRICLNCGTELHGKHCHECGQAGHVHRTLGAYAHDIAHGVFHFEGKVWRTLPLLALRPGDLTRRYIHGERANFVSPLALFLFSVFLTFAVVSSFAGQFNAPKVSAQGPDKSIEQIDAELKTEKAQRAALEQKKNALPESDSQYDVLDAQIEKIDEKIDGLDLARGSLSGPADGAKNMKVDSIWPPLDSAIKEAQKNPDLLVYKLQSSAYKYSWALIPLSTPFVWLLFFWKREYKMYDHAIFVTHSLTFMLLLVAALTLIGNAATPEPVVPLLGLLVPPLFTYRQLRGAYRVGWFGAIVRTFALMLFGTLALSLFVVLLVALGVMG